MGCVTLDDPDPDAGRSTLDLAREECDSTQLDYEAEYDVITVSGAYEQLSEYSFTADGETARRSLECLVQEIPIPNHVVNDMNNTRALDGTREASWGDFEITWNYHPDSGMNVTISSTSETSD